MILRVWHLAALALATVLLVSLVLPAQPAVALVALAGIVAAALLLARTRGIQLSLETHIGRLLDARARERALVETERGAYLERLRAMQQLVAEQQQALVDLVRKIDSLTEEGSLHEAGGAPPTAAEAGNAVAVSRIEEPRPAAFARSA